MLDLRVYRAAFVPVALAVVVVAFSLQDAPRPVTTTLAADAFDPVRASATLRGLAARFPAREPGSAGDHSLSREVQRVLRASGFAAGSAVRTRSSDGETLDGPRTLLTVEARRPGTSSRRIVVLAHRDARGSPAQAELSGTAALLELARVLAGRRLRRTLELVSTSGGSDGAAGAVRFAQRSSPTRPDAVVVLGDLASARRRAPLVVPWTNSGRRAPLRLQRTVEAAARTETGRPPGGSSALGQFARLALPLALGEQAELGARGVPAVLLSASGERQPAPGAPIGPAAFAELGRTALRTVTALDGGRAIDGGPEARVLVRGRVVPEWAVRLLTGALLVPALIALVDGFARSRRRRTPVARWLLWTLAAAVPFALAILAAAVERWAGALAGAPPGPVGPGALPEGVEAAALLAAPVAVGVLAWAFVRPALARAVGAAGDPGEPGAGVALALLGGGLGVAVWVANPFAAALLVPGVHLLVLATLSGRRPGPAAAALGTLAAVVPLAVVVAHRMVGLAMGPEDLAWTVLLQVAGGGAGPWTLAAWCLLLACVGGVASALHARAPAVPPPPTPSVLGPAGYAGPGSLGGTRSALRR